MPKPILPALLTVALGTATFIPLYAQKTANKPKPPAATATAPSSPAAGGSEVVGSVNGKSITWGQVIERLRTENPNAFNQSIAQAVALKAMDTFFGAKPQNQ